MGHESALLDGDLINELMVRPFFLLKKLFFNKTNKRGPLLVSFQGSTEGVFHENQVHNNFCFTLQKAILVSDEKGHQSLYCLGGDQCCSECDGNRKVWAHEAYQGQSMSLEEVFLFVSLFLCLTMVSIPKESRRVCALCVWCWRWVTSIQVKNNYFPFFCMEKKKKHKFLLLLLLFSFFTLFSFQEIPEQEAG